MRKIITLATALLLIGCQTTMPWVATPTAPEADIMSTPWDDRSLFRDGLTESARPILGALPGASVYHLEFEISDDLDEITGHQEVRYTNAEDIALDEVRFRLFPNILGGDINLAEVQVEGVAVEPNYVLQSSVLVVPLTPSLQPGQSTVVSMDFEVEVPRTVELNYGVLAYAEDVLALAHAYPMIAVYDDEGWNAEIPPQSGDVTYADMSFFLVKITAPREVVLVAAGRELSRADSGNNQVVTYAAGPVRDFYLAASRTYSVQSVEAGDVVVRFYADFGRGRGVEEGLDVAARSIAVFEKRYAEYPYTELDIVSTPTLALGIEYPGIIAITEGIIVEGHPYLEGTIAHEVAHQWFYNLVGNDQLDDPWLDESLAQFATLQYFTDEYGEEGNEGFRASLTDRMQRVENQDLPIGLPVAEYSDREYGAIVYGKGPLFFEALRDEMGTDAFDTFMREYSTTYSWGIATPDGLQAKAEAACACDLSALFEEWVYPP